MANMKLNKDTLICIAVFAFTFLVCLVLVLTLGKRGGGEGENTSVAESSEESEKEESASESLCEESENEESADNSRPSFANLTADNYKKLLGEVKAAKPAQVRSYHSYWELWCQGASGDALMRSGGCRVVAQCKLLAEMGLLDLRLDNPDSYLAWAQEEGFFMTGDSIDEYFRADVHSGEILYTGASVIAWARDCGLNVRQHHKTLSGNNSAADARLILYLLQEGYYVILEAETHQTYVARELSLGLGKAYLLDSYSTYSYTAGQVCSFETGAFVKYTDLYYYEIIDR